MGRADRVFSRAEKRFNRWKATGSAAELEASIAGFSKLESILAAWDLRRIVVDWLLGTALAVRAELTQSVADLDSAIVRLRRATSAPEVAGDDDLDGCHLMLGKALVARIGCSGGPDGPGDEELLDLYKTAVDALAVAARSRSETVPPDQRAEAATLRGHLMPSLVMTWAMAVRKAGEPPDCEALERTLRSLPAGHPDRPRLTLELGRAHLYLFFSDIAFSPESPYSDDFFLPGSSPGTSSPGVFSSAHREPAIRYLAAAMDLPGPAEPLLPIALAYLAIFHIGILGMKADEVLDHQTRDLVTRLLTDPGLNAEAAASLHIIMAIDGAGGSAASLAGAIDHLNQARRLAPEWEPVRSGMVAVFAELIQNPTEMTGSLDDRDAAAEAQRRTLERLEGLAGRGQPLAWYEQGSSPRERVAEAFAHPVIRQAGRASDEISAAFRGGDLARVEAALGRLREDLGELPAEHELRWVVEHVIGQGWTTRGALSGDPDDTIRGLRARLSAFELAEASRVTSLFLHKNQVRREKVYTALGLGWLTRDARALSAAIERMPALREDPSMTPAAQVDWAWKYGAALVARHELAGQPPDLDDGIALLEQATRQAGELDAGDADHGPAQSLSAAYWARGDPSRHDRERAIDTGLLALRQRAAAVLLQGGASQGLRVASWYGFGHIVQLVTWCLAEGRTEQAVAALELSRALVLHAATVAPDIPALLTQAGEQALASEWRTAAGRRAQAGENALFPSLAGAADATGSPGPFELPSALRRQVLGALRATPVGVQLLAAPALPDLAGALRRADADAFAYLIPPAAGHDGRVLLLSASGGLTEIPLPGLAETGPLDTYEAAYREAAASGWNTPFAWHRALDALCDWAWTAATGPLIGHAGQWPSSRPPRLVIIPVDRLSLVPWHAARTTGPDGQPHYAVQDAVFSYAASATQLAQAAARTARPPAEAPVLVANPTDDLPLAESEVAELLCRYYPGAAYLGQPTGLATGRATPDEVLSRLPGGSRPLASLLHCGCHAHAASPLTESRLVLSEGQPLKIADILAQAQRRDPVSPGFLAVLSACMTDSEGTDHDEALTLASALLAAGASGVVGARWPVSDHATAPLMLMFHHFLNNGHPHPADALREAQLRMLTGSPLISHLPEPLASAVMPSRRLRRPYYWAAFTYQGAHTQ
jgi:hypothetical protein